MPVGFELWIQRRNGNQIFCRAKFSLRNMRPPGCGPLARGTFSPPLLHRKLDCHKRRVGELQSRHFDALCDTWFVSFQGRICKLRRGCTPSASSARPLTLVAQTCQAQGTTMVELQSLALHRRMIRTGPSIAGSLCDWASRWRMLRYACGEAGTGCAASGS